MARKHVLRKRPKSTQEILSPQGLGESIGAFGNLLTQRKILVPQKRLNPIKT
jgi:hypothetical protein